MSDLIAFLRARLDEDEASGRHAGPSRILAARAIVALHGAEPGQYPDVCWNDQAGMPCPTLRILAAIYSHHAGYRQEWKP